MQESQVLDVGVQRSFHSHFFRNLLKVCVCIFVSIMLLVACGVIFESQNKSNHVLVLLNHVSDTTLCSFPFVVVVFCWLLWYFVD